MELAIDLLASDPSRDPVEIVERKGIGHPDTLCDALAERLSRALSRHYLEHFGAILHHNVDKALLCAGVSEPRLGGGRLVEPMEIYLAGRAVTRVGGDTVPVEAITIEETRRHLEETFHCLDAKDHVRIHCRVRPGSADLAELFDRGRSTTRVLANDTSFGVGYAPASPLERAAIAVERGLNAAQFRADHPAGGEDVKVMAARTPEGIRLTVARAFVDRHLPNLDAYVAAKATTAEAARTLAAEASVDADVEVNAADDLEKGSLFLTVTGTSAEAGDDGQVGRGNRVNGVITPHRPMSLEATAGKNPVSHVGKLYNVAAHALARALVDECDAVDAARCFMLSRIGHPIDEPQLVQVRIAARDRSAWSDVQRVVEPLVRDELARLPSLHLRIMRGEVELF